MGTFGSHLPNEKLLDFHQVNESQIFDIVSFWDCFCLKKTEKTLSIPSIKTKCVMHFSPVKPVSSNEVKCGAPLSQFFFFFFKEVFSLSSPNVLV